MNLVYASQVSKNARCESMALEQEKIRVLIANPTRIWRDLLYDIIREEPNIEVVGDVSDEDAVVSVAERTNPDCLIVPLDESGTMPIWNAVLAKRPHVRIVAIGEEADVIAIRWKTEAGHIRCTYTAASEEAILRALYFVTS